MSKSTCTSTITCTLELMSTNKVRVPEIQYSSTASTKYWVRVPQPWLQMHSLFFMALWLVKQTYGNIHILSSSAEMIWDPFPIAIVWAVR